MGRIVAAAVLENSAEPRGNKGIVALVNTVASRLALPLAWKGQLGSFEMEETIEVQIATQEVVTGIICGPAKIRVEGFRAIYRKVYGCEFLSSALRLLVVQPLVGAAAGGKPIFQLFLQHFDDCGLFGGEID